MFRKIRISLAAVFYVLITLLFLDFSGTLHTYFGWMAKIQLLPALLALNVGVVLALVVLTLVLGRVYCSVICPLGVMQDIFAFFGRKSRKNRYSFSPANNILRYSMLAVFAALIVAGFTQIAALIAPYSAYGRIASNLLAPLYRWGNNLLALVAEHYESYAFYSVDVWMKAISSLVIASVSLLVIALLAWRNGRTYCNTLCPVGTLLGLLSRYSYLRPVIDTDRCNGCGLCARNCKSACIDPKNHTIDCSRCVSCMDCIDKCRQGAISYTHPVKRAEEVHKQTPAVDDSRRKFLSLTALFAASATVRAQQVKVDGGLAAIQQKKQPERTTPLVPAGALSLRHLNQHCTACQLCVAECPNGVLRPSTSLDSLMQPQMSYERGFCRPECNRCSQICPTGAISPISKEEKSSIQIGHAVWIADNCIVNTDGVSCGNCARHCPNGAIHLVKKDPSDDDSLLIPAVDEARCIGCGACEYVCPSRPFSAIYVEGHQLHHSN